MCSLETVLPLLDSDIFFLDSSVCLFPKCAADILALVSAVSLVPNGVGNSHLLGIRDGMDRCHLRIRIGDSNAYGNSIIQYLDIDVSDRVQKL